jgi:hypothetical protein
MSATRQATIWAASVAIAIAGAACGEEACPAGTTAVGEACLPVGADGCASMVLFDDADGDGHGDPATGAERCPGPGLVAEGGDCDDASAGVHPGADEACNGVDDDCDDDIDEGFTVSAFYRDEDGDGFGDPTSSISACEAPDGYVDVDGDCNDACAECHEGATERCDGLDNDCDGMVDEGLRTAYYADCDRDGYPGATGETLDACDPPADPPASCAGGVWTTTAPEAGTADCQDSEPDAHPGATAWHFEPVPGTASYDWNCDGADEPRYTGIAGCDAACRGWWRGTLSVPACGEVGELQECATVLMACEEVGTSGPCMPTNMDGCRAQQCR